MSYIVGMSPDELRFIRVYVAALRRHYYDLRTAIDLMNPDGLNIKDFYQAAQVADRLNDMHDDFETRLEDTQKKHHAHRRTTKPHPTEDDIADLFSLSFFKLVTTTKDGSVLAATPHNPIGWFSGKPEEWQKTLKSYKKIPSQHAANFPELLSDCFNAFAKFFHLYDSFPKGMPPGTNKKVWPLAQDDMHEEYDYDDPDNPFGWLFEDEDD